MTKSNDSVSVIIPAFNEELGIVETLKEIHEVLSTNFDNFEIIVVNDGSSDNTGKAAGINKDIQILNHKENRGYGASLKTGIKKSKYDLLVIIDADGQYPADVIPEMVSQISNFDMIIGSRTGVSVKIPILRRPAKWFIKKLAEYVTSRDIKDLNSGLRCFRKSTALSYLHLLPDKFSFTTTLTVALLSDGLEIEYVEISYTERKGKSKVRARDFFSFTSLIIKLSAYFNPFRTFFPVGFIENFFF